MNKIAVGYFQVIEMDVMNGQKTYPLTYKKMNAFAGPIYLY